MATKGENNIGGYGFGAFQGVFTPSILTIIGVVMYLRFGWMLGNVGLTTSLLIVTGGSLITMLTGLSISALATNMRMKGGGAYFILSRSLGLEAGAAIGIPLALSQAIGVAFYIAGFAEALINSGIPFVSGWDPRLVGLATLVVLSVVSTLSADIALKSQYFIMAAIAISLVSFFLGGTPADIETLKPESVPEAIGVWPVFAIFFPAVTGILSGVGMSGDLKDPGKSIPKGTIAAVLVGYIIYMSVPIVLNSYVDAPEILRSDTMILQRCARWPTLILVGVWAATLSSAIGSFLCAPRVLQALSRDSLLPQALGKGHGASDDPRLAAACCFIIAAACVWLGDINIIAPILTLFNLSTYGLLNLSAAFEETMANPTWRPTFRVKPWLSFTGFAGCIGAMFMISPGWTFVALVCEGAIFWGVKRRALRAQWGDMRTGLYMALVRHAFGKLSITEHHQERNWRPNLLVMTHLPMHNRRQLILVRDIAGGRSLVTVASVLPESAIDIKQEGDLRDAAIRYAGKLDLEATVKLVFDDDEWSGLRKLVDVYGFGPIVPNTIVLSHADNENATKFGSLVRLMSTRRRNVVIADGDDDIIPDGTIDIWWRGKQSNGPLMLALAFLLQQTDFWRDHKLRVNMIVLNREASRADEQLDGFIAKTRINAETRIIESQEHFTKVIGECSADSAITFIGLRRPLENESDEAYGEYIRTLQKNLSPLPFPVFVLANEDIEFHRIFA